VTTIFIMITGILKMMMTTIIIIIIIISRKYSECIPLPRLKIIHLSEKNLIYVLTIGFSLPIHASVIMLHYLQPVKSSEL